MCRIESPALRKAESAGAAARKAVAEDRLIKKLECFAMYLAKRQDKPLPVFTDEVRKRMRAAITHRVKLA